MLLRKIFTRKRDGNDVLFRSLMIILYSMLIVLVIVSSRMITVMHNNIDDSIVSSGLAGALIDLDIFSEEDKLYIDKTLSLQTFENCMKSNLKIDSFIIDPINLDEVDFNSSFLGNEARIVEYRIYNVYNGQPAKIVPSDDPKLQPIEISSEKGAEIVKSVYSNGTWKSDSIIASTDHYEEDYHISCYESDIDAVIDQTSIYVVLEVPMQTYFGIKGILKQSKLFSIDKLM